MPNNRLKMPTLPFSRACLLALAIEAVFLLGAASMLAHAMTPQAANVEPPLELVFTDPPPTPPKEEPRVKPVVKAIAHPTPVKVVQAPPKQAPAPVVADSPVAVPQAPPAPPAPPPPQADKTAEKEAEFASRVKIAIQAAVVYPAAARNMGYRGKARVEFIFRDGSVHQAHIIQSSGIGMIDNAALAAVNNTRYPTAPDSLKGKDVPYQVTVTFDLNGGN